MKFGGTSVSSKKNIEQIRSILSQKSENFIVVVSAFSGVTNLLEKVVSSGFEQFVAQALLEEFRVMHFNMIKEPHRYSEANGHVFDRSAKNQ